MAIKVENKSSIKLNEKKLLNHIHTVLTSVPSAHLRGIASIVLVDRIEDPNINPSLRNELPGLYHPRIAGSPIWLEIAVQTLRHDHSLIKRLFRRMSFKSNVTTTLLSLIGQHYYLTLSHGVKRSQVEQAVAAYVDKHVTVFVNSQKSLRYRILRILRPTLEKLTRKLRNRYLSELKNKKRRTTKPRSQP